jgi:hypothetical protein
MLAAELRVNGQLIGHIDIVREELADPEKDLAFMDYPTPNTEFLYSARYKDREAMCQHRYGDEAIVLVGKAIEAILKENEL